MRTVLAVLLCAAYVAGQVHHWTYECGSGNVCVKKRLSALPEQNELPEARKAQSLAVCKLLCDPYAALWPRPTSALNITQSLAFVDALKITLKSKSTTAAGKFASLVTGLESYVKAVVTAQNKPGVLLQKDAARATAKRSLEIVLSVTDPAVVRPGLQVDESYSLKVSTGSVETDPITAEVDSANFFGARHGVETLLQLVVWSDVDGSLVLPSGVQVSDKPKYAHRGFLLDTARNFFSVESIKRTIDAMAQVKLNAFHWHITDSHSFPFVANSKPELHQLGAYTPEKIYTPEAIRDVVEFARVRGVQVIPEFDAPAHVGEGWQFGDADNLTVCVGREPWTSYCVEPPCGQLNPLKERVYEVLNGIYKDMLSVFDSEVFHFGGDEVNLNCWNSSEAVTDLMAEQGYGRSEGEFLRLWSDFQQRALDELTKANNGSRIPGILWTSHLTEKGKVTKYLDSGNYIIQIWTTGKDEVIAELVRSGFKVILSNYDALYFDCGYGAWVGEGNNWCSPYIGWQKVYENRPSKILEDLGVGQYGDLVLGAEAALWSEQVDEQTLDGKVWPRAAAMAERLWSDPAENWRQAEMRMINVRERLVARGVMADALQPEWCHQNDDKCKLYDVK
ncbi:chitooligosaccharidolytic beta-N-acetylglucosaminidase [Neocloeon triangulifer]|uniref:chitooligosaccharidolytic beta-N-acetylglucosaminidase n=1 Tax=Neocloeon triangulifer TaxID=2078957 RepID=UPI00286F78B6|nr:chitooligosaccharidolytic beta-N-acetylglucosaminidase [Neocloeon triangulifer]